MVPLACEQAVLFCVWGGEMQRILVVVLSVIVWLSVPAQAAASVLVRVSKGQQTMRVYVDGSLRHVWRVSTGRGRYATPSGSFRPQRLARRWYSTKYNGAPMPYSVFYHRGYAIHGTTEVRRLGRPASHGCVRLAPSNAAKLFALIKRRGMSKTRIRISN